MKRLCNAVGFCQNLILIFLANYFTSMIFIDANKKISFDLILNVSMTFFVHKINALHFN